MTNIQLSKAGKRRFNKKVKDLVWLLRKNEEWFLQAWNRLVVEWCKEIHVRAKTWKQEPTVVDEAATTEVEEDKFCEALNRLPVFGIYEKAEAILTACGTDVEGLVGYATRQTLEAECVKAIAGIYDNRLNSSLIQHWFYKRAKK